MAGRAGAPGGAEASADAPVGAPAHRCESAATIGGADGDVAQLGEHLLCKEGVRGSSPLISTIATDAFRRTDVLF